MFCLCDLFVDMLYITKNKGKCVDYFLQGFSALYIMMHQDIELLFLYYNKAINAFKVGFERGLKTYHFIWIEVIGCLFTTMHILIELKLYKKALKLLNTLGFESITSYEHDFNTFWNDSSRNLGDGLRSSLKLSVYLMLVLSSFSEDKEEEINIKIENKKEDEKMTTISERSQNQITSSKSNLLTDKSKDLFKFNFPVEISEVKEMESLGRFKSAGYGTLCSQSVEVLCLYHLYEEALELAEYALNTFDVTIKPTARSILHRCLGRIYFNYKHDKEKAEYHFEQSMIEGNKCCFRDLIHTITKTERNELFMG